MWRTMSSEEDKPPAPPVRLTSNRDRGDGVPPVERPLPKGDTLSSISSAKCALCEGRVLNGVPSLSICRA